MANQTTGKQNPEELHREIAQTRQNMEQNVQALQARLDPERLKYEAKAKIREQTVGRIENLTDNVTETVKGTGTDVFDTIKQNPLPAALAAIGLGWLFMETRNNGRQRMERSSRYAQYRYEPGQGRSAKEYNYDYPYAGQRPGYDVDRDPMGRMRERGADMRQTAGRVASNVGDTAEHMASSVGDTASHMASSVSDTASQVVSNVGDTASRVASNVSDTATQVASNVGEQMGEWSEAAQRGASQAKTRFEEILNDRPLLIGAAAVALGAAIGMSLPHTAQEDQFLGETRDNLMQKAGEQAKETVEKVQQVATKAGEAAKEAAKDEAQNQKLTT